jgi:hypothetical protein
MADLSPEARALVEAGRSALRPAAADRERILAALRARTAGEGGGGNSGAGTAGGGFGWPALAVTLVGVGIVIGGILYGLHGGATHGSVAPVASDSARAAASAPLAAELAPMAASALPAVAASVSADLAVPSATRAQSSRHTGDHLAEEVALMSRAETELHAGRFTNALELLDEHRREFPHGTLAQERLAARIQALCGLGRVKEADAALARLTRSSPQSLHEDSARAACAPNAKP